MPNELKMDDMRSKTSYSRFTKYTLSFLGSTNPDKFVVKLDKVAKISGIDNNKIKVIFRAILNDIIVLKDF